MLMKRGVLYSLIIALIVISILVLVQKNKLENEVPFVKYENSLDNNKEEIVSEANQEYFIQGNDDIGVMMIHGFGASPQQTKELAEFLAEKNITVYAIRVPGHGTNLDDMESKRWEDWYSEVEEKFESFDQQTKKTYVLGISGGALLTLNLASNKTLDGIIVIAPPIFFQDNKMNYVEIYKYIERYHYFGIEESQIGYAYENLPTKSIAELSEFGRVTKKNLNKIIEPILILQSNMDTLVNPKSAKYVLENVNSEQREIWWVNKLGHVIIRKYDGEEGTFDLERRNVYNKILSFILQ